jgi:hypothetical protein
MRPIDIYSAMLGSRIPYHGDKAIRSEVPFHTEDISFWPGGGVGGDRGYSHRTVIGLRSTMRKNFILGYPNIKTLCTVLPEGKFKAWGTGG